MPIHLRRAAAALAVLLAGPPALSAQAQKPVGTLIIAHGGGPAWDAQVESVASLVETGGPVEVSFLMGPGAETHRFRDAAGRLEEQGVSEIVVVPVLVSSHSGHYQQIRYLAGQTGSLSETMQHHLHMAGIELQHELTGRPGSVSREKLPRDLAGLPIVYEGHALLPHPGMSRWVEARVREAIRPSTSGRPWGCGPSGS